MKIGSIEIGCSMYWTWSIHGFCSDNKTIVASGNVEPGFVVELVIAKQ